MTFLLILSAFLNLFLIARLMQAPTSVASQPAPHTIFAQTAPCDFCGRPAPALRNHDGKRRCALHKNEHLS